MSRKGVMLTDHFFTIQRTTLIEVLDCPREKRKITGPSTCPGELAHDGTLLVILEYAKFLCFKADILVTVVAN